MDKNISLLATTSPAQPLLPALNGSHPGCVTNFPAPSRKRSGLKASGSGHTAGSLWIWLQLLVRTVPFGMSYPAEKGETHTFIHLGLLLEWPNDLTYIQRVISLKHLTDIYTNKCIILTFILNTIIYNVPVSVGELRIYTNQRKKHTL